VRKALHWAPGHRAGHPLRIGATADAVAPEAHKAAQSKDEPPVTGPGQTIGKQRKAERALQRGKPGCTALQWRQGFSTRPCRHLAAGVLVLTLQPLLLALQRGAELAFEDRVRLRDANAVALGVTERILNDRFCRGS
jgi:hypothetical protein